MKVCLAAKETAGADDGFDRCLGNLKEFRLTLPNSLVFENQRYRNQRHPFPADAAEDREGRSATGPKRRDDHVCIEDDEVHGVGRAVTWPSTCRLRSRQMSPRSLPHGL